MKDRDTPTPLDHIFRASLVTKTLSGLWQFSQTQRGPTAWPLPLHFPLLEWLFTWKCLLSVVLSPSYSDLCSNLIYLEKVPWILHLPLCHFLYLCLDSFRKEIPGPHWCLMHIWVETVSEQYLLTSWLQAFTHPFTSFINQQNHSEYSTWDKCRETIGSHWWGFWEWDFSPFIFTLTFP